ncbi:MAG: GSCFA domain-containing protein, partial [Ferruginibacter sp.]
DDMVHPNYAATNYVWEKFTAACIEEDSRQLMKELYAIQAAYLHKPFQPASSAHQNFLQNNLQKATEILSAYPYIDLKKEIHFFES